MHKFYYAVDERDDPQDAWSWTGYTYSTSQEARNKIDSLKLVYPNIYYRIEEIRA